MAGSATKKVAVSIVRRLRSSGHEALLAGGCVRDMLLARRPYDYDVATSATPDQVNGLFRRVLMIGAKFGVAMVVINGRTVEVTTFRSDLSYSDGRRPDAVKFVSAREDALRRDFTINGMFYDPMGERVVDYVGGREDIQAGIVRAIGDPPQRFGEDYLRMLRAVRFAGRFGFRIEPKTAAAIKRFAGRIVRISGERIREEMEKMLAHEQAAASMARLQELGLLEAILPELFAGDGGVPLERVGAVAGRADGLGTMAALLCDLPADRIRKIIRRWGGANSMRDSLIWMAGHLDDWQSLPEASLAQVKRMIANRDYRRLEALWRIQEHALTGTQNRCRAIRRRIRTIDPEKIAPEPLVTGDDLKKLGIREGPAIGRRLKAIYEAQLNEEITTRRQALRMARKKTVSPPHRGGI